MKIFAIPVLALAIALGGCTTLASGVVSVATSLSSSTPAQVTTLAQADLAADAIVRLTKAAVDTNKLTLGQLKQIHGCRAAVRAALDDLHAVSDAGHALNFEVFNAALLAWQAYTTAIGVKH